MEKQIREDIKKIESPAIRLLVYLLIASCVTLFWLFVSKGTNSEKDWKQLYFKEHTDCDSMRKETIINLQILIRRQQTLNESLKKIK